MIFPVMFEAPRALQLPKNVRISRFSMLAEGIYRGGQPDEKGFAFLMEQRIQTIINLRAEDDEGPMVKKLGMKYFHIPIRLVFPWSKIPQGCNREVLRTGEQSRELSDLRPLPPRCR